MSANDFGEADRIYNIYTKDFGKVSVLAKGVRLEKSKLRGHLPPYSLIRLSFVEGKEFMRLTDAEEILQLPLDEKAHSAFAGACLFFERMVRGQEKDEAVWGLLDGFYQCLLNTECLINEGFGALFKARLLHRLGYVSSDYESITANDWPEVQKQQLDLNQLQNIYNNGLSASQL